jgi:hypothetical protein
MDNESPQPVVTPALPRGSTPGLKLPGLRWYMISLIMLGSILNYTRNTLSVAQVNLEDRDCRSH